MLMTILITTSVTAIIIAAVNQVVTTHRYKTLQAEYVALKKHVGMLQHADLVINKQLKAMNGTITNLDDQQSNILNMSDESAYQQAIKMVEMGAGLGDITESCHLTRAEAELLLNLHQYKKSISR
jgi:Protein of unknown function (DUF2802)